MSFTEKLDKILSKTVEALGFEWVGCEVTGGDRQRILRLYIDKPQGITIDDCALVSRQVGAVLDVENVISGRYSLEVSSPGIERPLFRLEHFERFKGVGVRFRVRNPLEGQRNFKGVIHDVEKDQIRFQLENGSFLQVDFMQIEKASLIPMGSER